MDFREDARNAIIEQLPVLSADLKGLERKLEAAWREAYDLADKLQGAFNHLGSLLSEIRGNDDAYSPYQQAGHSTWKAYVEKELEPRMGISYVRATQIVNAYESGEQIVETLENMERRRISQLIAAQFNASLPNNIPIIEAPLRALAGLTAEEKTAVLGIAESFSAHPTFSEVKKAKQVYKAVKEGVIELQKGESLTVETVDNLLMYGKIIADCEKLPVLMLMKLEGAIADMIVRRNDSE